LTEFAFPVCDAPFTCGLSSSSLTALGRLLLLLETLGLVLALGPLECVPCWLCCGSIPGACAGEPLICGEPGRFIFPGAGDALTLFALATTVETY
jgi:hypothetical protein